MKNISKMFDNGIIYDNTHGFFLQFRISNTDS